MAARIAFALAVIAACAVLAALSLSAVRSQRIADRDALVDERAAEASPGPPREDGAPGAATGRLARAGISMPAPVWLAAVGATAFLAFSAATSLLASPPLGIACALAALLGANLYVSSRIKKRRILLEEQFGHACMQLAGSIRAGRGLDRAIKSTAAYVDDPLRSEFERVSLETRRDPDIAGALSRMADRTGSRDVAFLAAAVELNQRRGGRLADTVERLARTVATRQAMRREIRSQAADGKASAKAVAGIAAFLAASMFAVDPSFSEFYLENRLGLPIGAAAGLLFVVGCLWMHRITSIDVD